MYDFKIEAANEPTLYADLLAALGGLASGESDAVATGRGNDVLVCRYSPAGNIDGRRVP